MFFFFFSSRRRHTRFDCDWSSDVCSSDLDGVKDVLGLWIEQTEGAKFWLRVMTELQARGVQDVLFAVVDGLKGFPEAITSVFPQATIQTCIVHLLRHSLSFVTWKDRRPGATAL